MSNNDFNAAVFYAYFLGAEIRKNDARRKNRGIGNKRMTVISMLDDAFLPDEWAEGDEREISIWWEDKKGKVNEFTVSSNAPKEAIYSITAKSKYSRAVHSDGKIEDVIKSILAPYDDIDWTIFDDLDISDPEAVKMFDEYNFEVEMKNFFISNP